MGFHQKIWTSYSTNRCIQHGCGPPELSKKLWADYTFLLIAISGPACDNGRTIQTGGQILYTGRQYPGSLPDSNDYCLK